MSIFKLIPKVLRLQSKAHWIGWFVTVYLIIACTILTLLVGVGINPTLIVSPIAAPLWIGVAFSSKYITDKIME